MNFLSMWSGISRNRNITIIILFNFLDGACFSVWSAQLLPVFIKQLSGSETAVGWAAAAFGIAQIFGAAVAAYVGDILPRREIIFTGATCGLFAAAATLVVVRLLDMPLLYLTQALWGVYVGLVSTGSEALFADSVPSGQRGFIYNFKWIVQIVCYCVGYLVALVMLLQLGNDWQASSVQFVMTIGLSGHPIAHLLLFGLRQEDPISHGGLVGMSSAENGHEGGQRETSDITLESSLFGGRERRNASSCDGRPWSVSGSNLHGLESQDGDKCGSQVIDGEHGPFNNENLENSAPVNSIKTHLSAFWTAVCCLCTLNAVPYVVCFTDLWMAIGSGMTIQFVTLFLVEDVGVAPTWLMGSYIAISCGAALCSTGVRYVGEEYIGRLAAVTVIRVIGTTLLLLLALARGPMMRLSVILTLFIFRNAAMNSTLGITRSVIMDCVRKESRAKWSAFESFTSFTWAGSAVVGGYIAEAKGYQFTFLVTAIFHYLGAFALIPAAIAMRTVEREVRAARRARLQEEQANYDILRNYISHRNTTSSQISAATKSPVVSVSRR